MTKKRKSSTSVQKTSDGFIGRLFAQTQLPAHVTEEQDWYLDTPDVRLTRVFTIVLILHVVAVGGILAFKMVEKASTPEALAAIAATESTTDTTPATDESAAKSDQPATEAAAAGTIEKPLLVDHPSATEYQEYRVGSGESLISIAKKLGVSASEIREINNRDEGSALAVGSWIRVPKVANAPAPAPAEPQSALAAAGDTTPPAPAPKVEPKPQPKPVEVAKPAPKPTPAPAPVAPKLIAKKDPAPTQASKKDSYQVQRGDTLFGIARQFGIKYQDLMAANGIERPENLQAGQTLRVP
ncbi:MAG: LysM peptidoglycan-binding domain-containing protein [Verrucomicrobiae bacterium]|nr:LysM peptidoglycan-binding domain-containing protein [Verrucomicrobiae bacterium]